MHSRSITGFLLAIWLLLSGANMILMPRTDFDASDAVETSEETKDPDRQNVILKVTEAVQSTVSINLSFQSFLMDEFTLEDDEDEHKPSAEPFYNAVQKRIKILLRRIISPNAP